MSENVEGENEDNAKEENVEGAEKNEDNKNNEDKKEENPDDEGDEKAEEPLAKFEDKPIVARPYDSPTLEQTIKEVNDLIIKNTRPKIKMMISKKKKEFEGEYTFTDRESEDKFPEFKQTKDPSFVNVEKPVNKKILEGGFQANMPLIDFSCQVSWNRKVVASIQYEAKHFLEDPSNAKKGKELASGIPDEYDEEDNLEKKLEKFFDRQSGVIEEVLQSNEIIDVFQDDFEMLGDDDTGSGDKLTTNLKFERVFNDPRHQRKINCIRFHPTDDSIVAGSLIEEFSYNDRVALSGKNLDSSILFWNLKDIYMSKPIFELQAPFEITVFEFHPQKPNIIVCGLMNGQIALFILETDYNTKYIQNKSDREIPCFKTRIMSSIDKTHKSLVLDIKFIPSSMTLEKMAIAKKNESKEVNFFISSGEDGQIIFWDTRVMSKDPKHPSNDIIMNPLRQPIRLTTPEGEELGITNIIFDPNQVSTTFWAASDDGTLLKVDWLPSKQAGEGQKTVDNCKIVLASEKSFRPCLGLSRSPFYPDILMTLHDYYFSIWRIDLTKPIFHSCYTSESNIKCGQFSPTRPGVIFIGKSDGNIDIWDFIDQSHKASMYYNVFSGILTELKFLNLPHAQYLAVGDEKGSIHIFEVPKNLSRIQEKEFEAVEGFWKREARRTVASSEREEIRKKQWEEQEIKKLKEIEIQKAQSELSSKEHKELKERDAEDKYQMLLLDVREEFGFITKEDADKIRKEKKGKK